MKYVLVLGGSISGVGKGALAASIGMILQSYGYNVTFLKIDPYLNYDSSKMQPSEHGEVYVLKDGTECDLDLGTYERYCDVVMTKKNIISSGKILYEIINKEKNGDHNGGTLRFCTSYYEFLRNHVKMVATEKVLVCRDGKDIYQTPDVLVIELGGTIGDEETNICLRSLTKFFTSMSQSDRCIVSIECMIEIAGIKTNSIQISLNNLKKFGIFSDILVYRGSNPIPQSGIEKISNNCGICMNSIFWSRTCREPYEIPESYYKAGIYNAIRNHLSLEERCQIFNIHDKFLNITKFYEKSKNVGIITRYSKHDDPYISVVNSLKIAGKHLGIEVNIIMINYNKLECMDENTVMIFENLDGILLPGGFGDSGMDFKVKIVEYARKLNVPMLGICLGFQIMMIEFARNVLGMEHATSEEFYIPGEDLIIVKMKPEDKSYVRLGEREVKLIGEEAEKIFNGQKITEVFRHRYCLNKKYLDMMEQKGMKCIGLSDDRVVVAKLDNHRFYCGVQYHPEMSSRTNKVNPIFLAFIQEIINENTG